MSRDGHNYSRSFFGPVPEDVLTRLRERSRGYGVEAAPDSDEQHNGPIDKYAFIFFLREGGRAEDWNEKEKISIRRKMTNRWLESEWGKALRRPADDHHGEATGRWVGNSFEIGEFLGLDVLNVRDPAAAGNQSLPEQLRDPQSLDVPHLPVATGNLHDVHVSAVPGVSSQFLEAGPSNASNAYTREANDRTVKPAIDVMTPVYASTRVLQHAPEEYYARIISDTTRRTDDAADIGAAAPCAPRLVETDSKEVILRDRMLVRVYYSDINLSGQMFNEEIHRTSQVLEYKAYGEFLVVWRTNHIELYRDYGSPLREWISGHKRLVYIIPLLSTAARLSLYSFVDLTFSITCLPTHRRMNPVGSRLSFSLSKEGSRIFTFKLKSRSRAYDWIWMLWVKLGCRVPKRIDIKNPILNATVSIDLPDFCGFENEKIPEMFGRRNLIELGRESLSSLLDWRSLIERTMLQGGKLELAWQIGANLDWIWLDTDVYDKVRRWAVLCGLVVKESTPAAVLELRLAEHYPTRIYLKNGEKVNEPPGAEGYLKQIRPNSLVKHRVYLSTHDGNLFVLPVRHAYPPMPPGFLHRTPSPGVSARRAEIQRGAMQILHASGVCDLRNILAIRRAIQLVPSHEQNERDGHNENEDPFQVWYRNEEASPEDNQDEGGEKPDEDSNKNMHKRRSFELLLKSGHVIRFEAHTCRVALEWINRLRALTGYWKERHRIDAQREMDLAQAGRPRLTPHIPKYQDHPLEFAETIPLLVSVYTTFNWCMIDGCRSIVRGGKLFMRKGLRGQYKLVQMFLVTNHLVQYRIQPNSLLHPAMKKKICLSDAYVCSGYWAALALPDGEFDASKPSVGRRYRDGLETSDGEEDIIFMICYRPPAKTIQDTLYHTDPSDNVPSISAKRKTLIFRTRSKLERDSWCWAINCEIEKTVRMQKDREDAIRNSGDLTP